MIAPEETHELMEQTSTLQSGPGDYLRMEREKRQITIEQVASATKISVRMLQALESDNYDALPAKPFVRGFVSSYAKYIGLDHKEILVRFDDYVSSRSAPTPTRVSEAPHIFVEKDGGSENSRTGLTIVIAASTVIAIVAFLVIKPNLKRKHRHAEQTSVKNEELVTVVPPSSPSVTHEEHTGATNASAPPVQTPSEPGQPATVAPPPVTSAATTHASQASPVEPPAAPAAKIKEKPAPPATAAPTPIAAARQTPNPTPVAVQTPSAAPAPAKAGTLPPIPNAEVKHRLIVRATEDSWVKYQSDDRPIQQFTLKKEKTIFIRARESIRFTSARPSGLEISFNNIDFKPLGSGTKLLVIPKERTESFKEKPFLDSNPGTLTPSGQ